MLFVAALLPVVIYILVVYQIDNFALVSVRHLLLLMVCGMLSALACFGLSQLTGRLLSESQSHVFNPVLEETVKAMPLLFLAIRKRIVFFIDSVICGAAVGGGFSILENVFYLLMGDGMVFGSALFRGLVVALIHMGCSAIVAIGLMLAVSMAQRFHLRLGVSRLDVAVAAFLLLVAPVLHICHNIFFFNPLMQFVFVLATSGGLLLWTYYYDVDMIHRWIDQGLDKHLQLLDSIKNGQLDNTPTGNFLVSVKDNFPPEVFFDIICYVQLHVELLVAAKSRVMIRESSLTRELPLTDEKKALILSQYQEYKLLEKTLGKFARLTIAPVVKYNPADYKALEDLKSECRA